MEKASGIKIIGRRALIGRGFLGSVLDHPGRFTDRYNSTNIRTMSGEYDLIVIAAPYASKWWANDHPDLDFNEVQRITSAIARTSARKVVLLSSIDAGVEHPYGKNREWLETFMPFGTTIIRLPALFGNGLKKNALFDLLAGERIANQVYHWYNVERLWDDVQAAQPGLWIPYSAPLSMWEIAEALGRTDQVSRIRDPHLDYNERGPFTMTSEETLKEIVQWATSASA